MPFQPTFHPRDEVWPGQVPLDSEGRARRRLARDRKRLAIHYTGETKRYLDPDDSPQRLSAIQRYAQSADKPWEYNYVVDGQGQVWEYAGEFMAAHSKHNNATSYGVLLLLGTPETPTDEMIDAARWLRFVLTAFHNLSADHVMLPHRDMPRAATAVPGPAGPRQVAPAVDPLGVSARASGARQLASRARRTPWRRSSRCQPRGTERRSVWVAQRS